jgi:hypothetical protein
MAQVIETGIWTDGCIHATREALQAFFEPGKRYRIGVLQYQFVLQECDGPDACYSADVHYTLARHGLGAH